MKKLIKLLTTTEQSEIFYIGYESDKTFLGKIKVDVMVRHYKFNKDFKKNKIGLKNNFDKLSLKVSEKEFEFIKRLIYLKGNK